MGYVVCFMAGGFIGVVLFAMLDIASEIDRCEECRER